MLSAQSVSRLALYVTDVRRRTVASVDSVIHLKTRSALVGPAPSTSHDAGGPAVECSIDSVAGIARVLAFLRCQQPVAFIRRVGYTVILACIRLTAPTRHASRTSTDMITTDCVAIIASVVAGWISRGEAFACSRRILDSGPVGAWPANTSSAAKFSIGLANVRALWCIPRKTRKHTLVTRLTSALCGRVSWKRCAAAVDSTLSSNKRVIGGANVTSRGRPPLLTVI